MSMDKSYIKSVVQNILNSEFTNTSKRRINEYTERINFACPYCGDSQRSDHKKRGNVYFNKLLYICFKCDKKTSFDRFCKDHNMILDPDKKMEMIEYLNSVVTYSDYDTDFVDAKLDNLISLKDLEHLFNVKNITPIYDFTPISPKSGVYKYLLGRGITPEMQRDIYQAKYSKGDQGYDHILVFLNRRGDGVLGIQVRNLREGKKRFFLIYNWETLYKWIHGESVDLDINKTILYNKLSYYFNILNVNFEDRITIFEGYLDSIFYPNSIGIVGVNTDLKFLENNGLDLQYFFDNDEAGYKKSEEKIKEDKSVFLWKMLFDGIVEKKKSEDPHRLLHRISKVKDLNKLNELLPGAFSKLNLSEFFSKDVLDLKYLPKFVRRKGKKEVDYSLKFKQNEF